ncbi:hypothetical protein [Pseudobacillus wudalianchiensis]|uniref:Uncharacterized protein n=1 Tax=Pseudobacillus wudalianchiensis TaxID=1743143 RepID=A0A1B9B2G3_9BACI|nr:hypothetical protein [Bacillus wudalianchiensis]OCA90301.1 hypothetical protein A8F95_21130 [Bacillus wudalianchiensis]
MRLNYKNERLLAAKLIDDITSELSEFRLLNDQQNLVDFFTGVAFGLKEAAFASTLAYEYGN